MFLTIRKGNKKFSLLALPQTKNRGLSSTINTFSQFWTNKYKLIDQKETLFPVFGQIRGAWRREHAVCWFFPSGDCQDQVTALSSQKNHWCPGKNHQWRINTSKSMLLWWFYVRRLALSGGRSNDLHKASGLELHQPQGALAEGQ